MNIGRFSEVRGLHNGRLEIPMRQSSHPVRIQKRCSGGGFHDEFYFRRAWSYEYFLNTLLLQIRLNLWSDARS